MTYKICEFHRRCLKDARGKYFVLRKMEAKHQNLHRRSRNKNQHKSYILHSYIFSNDVYFKKWLHMHNFLLISVSKHIVGIFLQQKLQGNMN